MPDLHAIRRQIAELDPVSDHQTIVQLTLRDGFLWDFVRSLELALFRTFAAPPVGQLLHRTGEFERNGQKRYDDTALLLLTILRDGYDSPAGAAAIDRMNRSHGHYRIANDDFLFVLSTFVIDPIQWIEQYGWRPLTDAEKQSLFLSGRGIGQRMGIRNLPDTRAAMEAHSWAYVARVFEHDTANAAVADGTIAIVQGWLPPGLRWAVRPVAASLLDPATRQGVGMAPPPPGLTPIIRTVLRLRARALRLLPKDRDPNWPDGRRSYPQGYTIEDLAPRRLLAAEARKDERAA